MPERVDHFRATCRAFAKILTAARGPAEAIADERSSRDDASRIPATGRRRRSFIRSNDGATAVIFALTLVPIVFSAASVVDYANVVAVRTRLQSAVDAAAIGSLTANPAGPTDVQTRQFLSTQLPNIRGVALTAGISSSSGATTTITAANGTTCAYPTPVAPGALTCANSSFVYTPATSTSGPAYQVTVTGSVASMFSSLVHPTAFTVKSTVSRGLVAVPSSAQILLSSANGIYWKQVKLFVHNAGAPSDSVAATYTYQITSINASGQVAATVTVLFPDGSSGVWDKLGNIISGTNKTVSLGSSYDRAYLVQTVSPSGCPAGQAPDPTRFYSAFTCIAAGSIVTSANGQLQSDLWIPQMETLSSPTCVAPTSSGCASYAYTVNPVGPPWTMSTNDPTTSNSLFVSQSPIPQPPNSNVQIAQGSTPPITQLMPCGQVTYWALEDTPWKSGGLADSAWQSQDLLFTIQGVQCGASSAMYAPVALKQ